MARPEGLRIARLGDGHGHGGIATGRLFGDSASVAAPESFGRRPGAAGAGRHAVAMVPVHSAANKKIPCADTVPVMGRAGATGLRAPASLELPVDHVLASFGGIGDIKHVYSKGEALAQCSEFLDRRRMGRSTTIPGSRTQLSTSSAARYVARSRVPFIAAICSEPAAKFHGVPIVQRNIADSPDNSTTFHAYARADSDIPAPAPHRRERR